MPIWSHGVNTSYLSVFRQPTAICNNSLQYTTRSIIYPYWLVSASAGRLAPQIERSCLTSHFRFCVLSHAFRLEFLGPNRPSCFDLGSTPVVWSSTLLLQPESSSCVNLPPYQYCITGIYRVNIQISHPGMVKLYHSESSLIDQHNLNRQLELDIQMNQKHTLGIFKLAPLYLSF